MRHPCFLLVLALSLPGPALAAAPAAAIVADGAPVRGAGAPLAVTLPLPEGRIAGVATAGGPGIYSVRSGDNLTLVAARLGASLPQLLRENPLDGKASLRIGQALLFDNRHVVPPSPVAGGDAILVNIPQRMLFHYMAGQPVAAYPAAAGRRGWETPTGDTFIASREKDKAWVVPPSIQQEMRREGKPVQTRVAPGPQNPLGRYWLGLARQGYGIHGTNAPASVYGARTHGCIRLQPEHIEELFGRVGRGLPVRIVYAPVLLFAPPDGTVWLEAHPDAYDRRLDYLALARALADEAGVTERVDWPAAESVLKEQTGIARDVAARPPR